MQKIKPIIKQYWGYETLYPLQPEAMTCVAEGRDSLVVLPTGGGKSLCYQAPVLAMSGMAVVISPLLSLMKDQVDALNANGVPSVRIDSSMTASERTAAHEAIQARRVKLLYVSPERMAQPSFIAYIQVIGVAYFVVDEAHCISHWGHDFRPEYRALRALRDNFPDTAIHAYTATATKQVRRDIIEQLHLRDPEMLTGVFDRPNLHYRVAERTFGVDQILEFLDNHPGESGIVYCLRRADVDELCQMLKGTGRSVLPYHAGMTPGGRKESQDAFSREDVDIIVATIAFGMGIDKSNVRFVLHTAMPKSIEHYQQETGRAGRDGMSADCCLLYSYQDFRVWESIIKKSEDPAARNMALRKLHDMLGYAQRLACRHKALSEYFGQGYEKKHCNACDVCLEQFDTMENSGEIVQMILRAVQTLDRCAGPWYTTQVLAGSQDAKIMARKHNACAAYGKLASFNDKTVRDWIEQLVQQGYLEKQGEYSILTVTPQGSEVLAGAATPQLKAPAGKPVKTRKSAAPVLSGPVDSNLFELLRQVRLEKARELNVPPFVIFSDVTLRDMARRLPDSPDAFLAVAGVGEKKCEAFGNAFLDAIRTYLADHPETTPDAVPATPLKHPPKLNQALQEAKLLFRQGMPLEEAARRLNRRPSTIQDYLAQYFADNNLTDPSPYASTELLERIRPLYTQQGDSRLRPLYDALNGEVPYWQIRICISCLKNLENEE